uniref:Reverse transcriptase n=1 Tax=Peronospora matthiolae TaxID=2874970 RepID=A0AAV1UBC5_9STRA
MMDVTERQIVKEDRPDSDEQRSLEAPAVVNNAVKAEEGYRSQKHSDDVIRQAQEIAIGDDHPVGDDQELELSDQKIRNATVLNREGDVTGETQTKSVGHRHDSGDLFAEDVGQHMALLTKIIAPTKEVAIDDIQVGDPGVTLTDDQEKLRQMIWKNRQLLIGKGNALPPAARGAVCDIDVGGAKPIAQRVRPVAPKYREKLADLIKGSLSAKIIQPSISPWASPIVVIIKKNGEDIRLCIDYRRVNQLTRLMI